MSSYRAELRSVEEEKYGDERKGIPTYKEKLN